MAAPRRTAIRTQQALEELAATMARVEEKLDEAIEALASSTAKGKKTPVKADVDAEQ